MKESLFEKKWLIKSENRILGPYHFEQIEELLKKRQISLIDEVRDMDTRWLYIRENINFKSIVEDIRKEIDSKTESTKTYQTASKTHTGTDVGAQRTNADPQFTEVDVLEASIIHEQSGTVADSAEIDFAVKGSKAKIYGLPRDQFFRKKVASRGRRNFLIVIACLFVIAASAGAFVWYQKRSVRLQEEDWMAQIKKYQYLGFNQKAVELFSKLPDRNQKKILPQVLSIFPLLEAENLVQSKDIEAVQNSADLSVEQKTNVQMIYFLGAMQNQNLGLALDAIVKARALQPASDVVIENLAILDLKKGHFQSSFDSFQSLYRNEKRGRYLLGSLQAFAGLPMSDKGQLLQALLHQVEAHTSTYYDYKKELLLGQMALAHWMKNDVLFKVSWGQFLNTPLQMATLFRRSLLIYGATYNWQELEEYKIAVRAALTPEEITMFEIHNYLEAGQVSAATQYSENNLAKVKDLAVKQQMMLLILNAQARRSEILVLEKTNQLDMRLELNHIILALNKIELNPSADISAHVIFLKEHQLIFLADWITLVQLEKAKKIDQIHPFLREHFVTVTNFLPVIEARSMIE